MPVDTESKNEVLDHSNSFLSGDVIDCCRPAAKETKYCPHPCRRHGWLYYFYSKYKLLSDFKIRLKRFNYQGFDDVSFRGSDEVHTPNIDTLALSGAVLNNYYATPLCTPSRSALMTGKHPIHTGCPLL